MLNLISVQYIYPKLNNWTSISLSPLDLTKNISESTVRLSKLVTSHYISQYRVFKQKWKYISVQSHCGWTAL